MSRCKFGILPLSRSGVRNVQSAASHPMSKTRLAGEFDMKKQAPLKSGACTKYRYELDATKRDGA